MEELTQSELLEIEGGSWKSQAWNVIQSSASGATVGGLAFGVPGAVIGAHYGAVAYAIGYAIDKKK